jgi:hypothetical protein
VADRRLRPVALASTVVGIAVTLVALLLLPWVHHDAARSASSYSDWVIFFDDPAGRHTPLVWVLFVACAVTALLAGWTAATWSLLLRCIAPLLAAGLALVMTWQVYTADLVLPSGLMIETGLEPGFWVTLLGLALVALGSAFGAARPR